MEKVKSSYIIKLIFTYIDEEQKLKLIKSTKSLQNSNNISIINYKLFSGKYIVYETNTNGKEYDIYNNNLLFEGEYLKGKRNGKGKGYDSDGNIIYEIVDGKREVTEYTDKELIFKGIMKMEKRMEKGKNINMIKCCLKENI